MENSNIIFNVNALTLLVAIVLFFISLLAIIWKGKKEIANTIKESIGDFKDRFISLENKMEILWKDEIAPARSPSQLNDRGKVLLNESGIKDIVDDKKDELVQLVKEKNTNSPYDAKVAIEYVMSQLPKHFPDVIDKLKNGAFETGSDIESILFASSIYLRNQIFKKLRFSVTDLDDDKSQPNCDLLSYGIFI
ncbi:hypothetical protein H6775_00410 [Candidatus Nomurabacteria bacterium]|nr:hypothetical protein [Candidatus Nomurabacteria bacterium]